MEDTWAKEEKHELKPLDENIIKDNNDPLKNTILCDSLLPEQRPGATQVLQCVVFE